MKHEEFNPVLFEEAYDALLERFSEYQEGCPKRRSAASDAQKKANQAGEAPKKQAPRKKPEVAKKPDAKPKRKKSCRTPLPTYSETLDFAKGTGKPCGASHISASYVCRLDAGEREAITKGLVAKGATKSKLDKLSDEQISRVAEAAKKGSNIADAEKESLVKRLGGDDLSDKEVSERVQKLKDYEAKYGEARMEQLGQEMLMVSQVGNEDYVYKKTPRGEEIEAIQNDKGAQEKLINGFENPGSLQKGGENAVIKFREVSDEDVEMVWALSTSNAQNSFKNAGTVPTKDAWAGYDENGNNSYGSNSVERGKMLMKRWMEQGGLDAYSGKPLTLNNADLEHIKPFSVNRRNAEQPDNWLWVSRGLNTSKGNKDMKDFIAGVNKLDAAKESEAHRKAVAKATEVGGKADLKARVKESGFMTKLEAEGQRKAIVDSYAAAGLTRYLASPLGAVRNPEFPEADKIKFVDKTGPNRGQVKQLLQTNARWKEGKQGSGTMTASEWIARNYPGMTPAQRSKFKNLFRQARSEADADKAAGKKATGGTFTQRLADLTAEAFAGEQY